jgi:hypothetical protein
MKEKHKHHPCLDKLSFSSARQIPSFAKARKGELTSATIRTQSRINQQCYRNFVLERIDRTSEFVYEF